MSALVLGVDGGNTKTVALLAGPDGTVVGSGRGGGSDIYGTPSFEAAIGEISLAVHAALPDGSAADDVGTAVFSLAGADWDEDKADLLAALSVRRAAGTDHGRQRRDRGAAGRDERRRRHLRRRRDRRLRGRNRPRRSRVAFELVGVAHRSLGDRERCPPRGLRGRVGDSASDRAHHRDARALRRTRCGGCPPRIHAQRRPALLGRRSAGTRGATPRTRGRRRRPRDRPQPWRQARRRRTDSRSQGRPRGALPARSPRRGPAGRGRRAPRGRDRRPAAGLEPRSPES